MVVARAVLSDFANFNSVGETVELELMWEWEGEGADDTAHDELEELVNCWYDVALDEIEMESSVINLAGANCKAAAFIVFAVGKFAVIANLSAVAASCCGGGGGVVIVVVGVIGVVCATFVGATLNHVLNHVELQVQIVAGITGA